MKFLITFFLFVNFVCLQASELVSITYETDEFFIIKNVYFLKDNTVPFPLKKGEQFIISNEQKHELPDNSYFMTMTLSSQRYNASHHFTSTVASISPTATIKNILEKRSYIEEFLCTPDDCSPFACWLACNEYKIELEDGQVYSLTTNLRKDSPECAEAALQEIPAVQPGDQILWREGGDYDWFYKLTGIKKWIYRHSRIYRDGVLLQFFKPSIVGTKRSPPAGDLIDTIQTLPSGEGSFAIRNMVYNFDANDAEFLDFGCYTVISEEIVKLAKNSYEMIIGINSCKDQKTHYFVSVLLSSEAFEKVTKVNNEEWSQGSEIYFYYADLTLESGYSYRLEYRVKKGKSSFQEFKKSISVNPGDQVNWESCGSFRCFHRLEYTYEPKLKRAGKVLFEVLLTGPLHYFSIEGN